MTTTGLERVSMLGGTTGEWAVQSVRAIRGEALPQVAALTRTEGPVFLDGGSAAWMLRGVRSNERYVERAEKERLAAVQQGLGRPDSRMGALIPMRKSAAWWELPQDDRRAIFEARSARSRHIEIGARFLPAIARRLYHCRDLGEPFDFLTWFEFAESDAGAFDELLGRLRDSEEWRYVDREVELRLRRR